MSKYCFIFFFAFCIVTSCKKEPISPYVQLIGNYDFTIFQEDWYMGIGSVYDTLNYSGQVNVFEAADASDDLNNGQEDISNPVSRLTIRFLPDAHITPLIYPDGTFEPLAYYFNQSGNFNSDGSVNFVVWFGGLGATTTYTVHGEKTN